MPPAPENDRVASTDPDGTTLASAADYRPLRAARSLFVEVRGLTYHVHAWGDAALATPDRPPLVLLHGWMDVGASFQFVVDALAAAEGFERHVLAPDWRGFGLTTAPASDCYWFPDYVGDLDALLDALAPGRAVDLVGHSMGGNVVMSYAGVRPDRIRRLVNLEGFGLPRAEPRHAPQRLAKWLDSLKAPQSLRDYAGLDEVAERLRKNNPRLAPDKARWLATHWARPDAQGRWRILGDPAHKRPSPMVYRVDEILETWRCITAPLLWIEGDATELAQWWGTRYSVAEFHQRLDVVPRTERHRLADCGHMLHHDQPEALARRLAPFLGAG
ncbi:MAG: alpha/beta fold hydrolase [Pseudomonadota bacterium]|jgi:pimeloyl-ACP methyl ester carboxylesterase|nr:alpha/beta hydrolase [Rubrivivax sp.]MCA3257912.1 alpha/beta hydrolase [Rubrivivax sp.]MCE2912630.1 alpha/beta hydrolase [Rubrivivax sp.]MCZ8030463.1 alpha/beta hydrolase [Rubrivivax sp.]